MDAILQSLSGTPGVEASMLVSKEGLVIEQAGRLDDMDIDLLAATASEMYTSAESAGERFNKGGIENLTIEANGAKILLSAVNSDVFLLVLTRKKINLGLVRWEVQSSAEKLKGEL